MSELSGSTRSPMVVKLANDSYKKGSRDLILREGASSVRDLCDIAGILCTTVSSNADTKMIALMPGEDHYLSVDNQGPFYIVGRDWIEEPDPSDVALRMLEVMAYTFNEASSRQCLNKKGYFVAPPGSYRSQTK